MRRRGRDGDGDYRRAESGQVIGPSGAVRVLVATRPVDFRKGAEGLAALVRDMMGAEPFDGAVYVFRARRADRVKLCSGTARACACLRNARRTADSNG
jgi:transposase